MNDESQKMGLPAQVYGDLAKSSTRAVGRALGDIVGMIAEPIGRAAEIGRKNILKYVNRMDGENAKDVIPVRPEVAIPILDKFRYTEQEELASRYVELLAKESLEKTQGTVLPSYIEILSQLSPDEVRVIDGMVKKKGKIIFPTKEISKEVVDSFLDINVPKETFQRETYVYSVGDLPCVEIRGVKKDSGFIIYEQHYNCLDKIFPLDKPENKDIYLVNLARLGLIQHLNAALKLAPVYKTIKEGPYIEEIKKQIKRRQMTISIRRRKFVTTKLAKHFVSICSNDKEQNKQNGNS